MRDVWIVAQREFTQRARDRSFLLTNAFILIVLAGSLFAQVLFSDDDPERLGAVGPQAQAVAEAARAAQDQFEVELEVSALPDRAAAEQAVRDGDVDAALVDARTVVVEEDLNTRVRALLSTTGQAIALDSALDEAGVPEDQRAALAAPLAVEPLGEPDPGPTPTVFLAFGASSLLYGLLVLLGQFIAQGIVEEKTSRVVEVLLSAIRPVQLLAGKVLGLGLLGFLQVLAISAVGLGVSVVGGLVEAPPGTVTVVALALGWFVLGYAQYASLFAGVGAVASRIEELQGLQMVALVPVIGAFFAASSALAEPDGLVARITALTPFTAPLVQPLRTVAGVAPAWEPFAAVLVSIVTAVGLVPLAARFYSGGVLQVRQRVSFGAAWRAGA